MDIQLSRTRHVRRAYGIDEIALVPGDGTVDPSLVQSHWTLGGIERPMPVIASAMDSVVDVSMAVQLSQLGALGVLNLEGLQARYDDPGSALEQIAAVEGEGFVGLMQELYSKPIREELIVERVRQIKAAGGIAAVSATPAGAMAFGHAVATAGADVFFVQATVVSTRHQSPPARTSWTSRRFVRKCPCRWCWATASPTGCAWSSSRPGPRG